MIMTRSEEDRTSGISSAPPTQSTGLGTQGFRKSSLVEIAASTLEKMKRGSYDIEGRTFEVTKGIQDMKDGTMFFSEASDLSEWRTNPSLNSESNRKEVEITVTECSVLSGARSLNCELNSIGDGDRKRIGVLNFASAKNPGGGFLTGAQAQVRPLSTLKYYDHDWRPIIVQEESIARSSTIYASLITDAAQSFYRSHRKNPHEGYYSHAMIYSPRVHFIRSDDGSWHEPIEVDVVTSCAVNAGVVRRYLRQAHRSDEGDLDKAMKERMARVLYLFEKQGVRNLVLGSFGTGVFRNRVELVAQVWKELMVGENARFRFSFDRVEFSILGNSTYTTFNHIFSDGDLEGQKRANT